jgi:hypothetical protein
MLEYNPVPNHRIVWYGGDSNMLHFEWRSIWPAKDNGWTELSCQTIMDFPTGAKELLQAMQDYYQQCVETYELSKT